MAWFGGQERRRRGTWFGLQERRAEARAVARANILNAGEPPAPSPLAEPGTIIWRFDGRDWERWSDLWQAYEPEGEVPGTLTDQLAAEGVSPATGDRFRFDGTRWDPLGPGDDERSPVTPDAATTPAAAGRPHDAPRPAAPPATRPVAPASQPDIRAADRDDDVPDLDRSGTEPVPERPSTEEMLEAWRRRTRGG